MGELAANRIVGLEQIMGRSGKDDTKGVYYFFHLTMANQPKIMLRLWRPYPWKSGNPGILR